MANDGLHLLTIAELGGLLRSGRLSALELTRAYLERIERLNPTLGGYITVMGESALDEARRAESEIAGGSYRGALHGVRWQSRTSSTPEAF